MLVAEHEPANVKRYWNSWANNPKTAAKGFEWLDKYKKIVRLIHVELHIGALPQVPRSTGPHTPSILSHPSPFRR